MRRHREARMASVQNPSLWRTSWTASPPYGVALDQPLTPRRPLRDLERQEPIDNYAELPDNSSSLERATLEV